MGAPAVTVVVGSEELLTGRAVARVLAEVGGSPVEASTEWVAAAELTAERFAELTSPTLFGGGRGIVVTDLADAGKEVVSRLVSYASAPAEGVAVVAVHTGSKGKAALEALREAGASVVDCPGPRWPEDKERFVSDEVRAAGGSITRPAAQALLAAVGGELRELANACAQLVADSGGRIDEEVVARYHRGRADAGSFAVADRAVDGDAAGALELLRAALAVGQSPAGVTAALAGNLRTIALVAGAGRGSPQQLATQLALPPWKVKKAQGWARGWQPAALATALVEVAEADAAVKGAAADPAYAIERVVLRVAEACRGR